MRSSTKEFGRITNCKIDRVNHAKNQMNLEIFLAVGARENFHRQLLINWDDKRWNWNDARPKANS